MTPDAQPSSHPAAREDVVFRPLAGEWVLYDPETAQLHVLNATAALVWGLCDGKTGSSEMAAQVREHLPEAPGQEEVEGDVAEVLKRFRAEGLLR